MKRLLITIDGPGGAGKTTVSRKVARRLEYTYVDTGALYRAVALAVSRQETECHGDCLEGLLENLNLEYKGTDQGAMLMLDGEEISEKIRTPEITMLASRLSAQAVVRKALLGIQRRLGRGGGVIFEGRDMGTVVFPGADLKFFLYADPEIRAWRRYKELLAKGQRVDLDEVARDMEKRDRDDSSRTLAPLKPAEDAISIDSSALEENEVVEAMLSHIGKLLK